jgi:FKBP-type peptidyl-prolyl cis-trans isomerase
MPDTRLPLRTRRSPGDDTRMSLAPRRVVTALALAWAVAAGAAAAQKPNPAFKPPAAPPNVSAPPADATTLPSGLAFKVLTKGTGTVKPGPDDLVRVDYTGWTADGKLHDASGQRLMPHIFPLGKLIKGWSEGLQTMTTGETRRLWIPPVLAYKGQSGRPQGMLVYDVTLLEVLPPPTTPPPDVAAPPADALKTPTGIAYKRLKQGDGLLRPNPGSRVTVHYTGWTTDGKMFDSSLSRGIPATFTLGEVIAGWTEGVQLMSVGDRMRFWIPEELAYQGQAGSPQGMLVFDIELINFDELQ